jgi:hypothetical protein
MVYLEFSACRIRLFITQFLETFNLTESST